MLSLPTAIGPYSQAVKANGFISVSGQIPATPQGNLVEGTVVDKTRKMCQNAEAVLGAAGSSLAKKREIRRAKNGGYRGICQPPVHIDYDLPNLYIYTIYFNYLTIINNYINYYYNTYNNIIIPIYFKA